MPLRISTTVGGLAHAPVFVGQILATDVVKIDISDFSSNEIDANGFLKSGVPLAKDGNIIGSGVPVYGVTIEPVKIADGNAAGDISGATDCFVTVGTIGTVNRDIIEDNLGRALTSDEIAGFALAGCRVILTRT